MNDFLNIIPLVLLGSVAGLVGGLVYFVNKNIASRLSEVSIPLATGILLTLSFLHLLPESVELIGDSAYLIVLGVFVVLFLIERFFFHIHHHEGDHKHHDSHHKNAVPLVIFGDTIHNFLDGAAIASAYLIDPALGFSVAIATFLHETPHEIADFGILLSAGWKRSRAFLANFLSALATFPGALLAFYYSEVIENSEGFFVALAAGLFLYVAATDFLPEVGHHKGKFSYKEIIFFLLGVIIVAGSKFLIPEQH